METVACEWPATDHPESGKDRSMKTKDIVIGKTYAAKVSGTVVPVRIIRESPYGGWDGVNTQTGRQVRIKSPQRLRREVTYHLNLS